MAELHSLGSDLCWEIAVIQRNKHEESLCGDHVVVSAEGEQVTIVLSDGLGSGVQANIASTLTATLLAGYLRKGMPLTEGVRTVEAVLPVTKRQNLAYATFNLISASGRDVRLVQFDSPQAVFFRDGVSLEYPFEQQELEDKSVQVSELTMKAGDMLIVFSDGVSEAGRGVTTYAGWERREMEDYLFRSIKPEDHARHVAASIVSTVQALDLFDFHDDTSVAVLRLRERSKLNLLLGPSDAWVPDGETLPPISVMEGVELAVEGDVTFAEALESLGRYREDGMLCLSTWKAQDGASQLINLLAEEASEIELFYAAEKDNTQTDHRTEQVLLLRDILTNLGKTVKLSFC